MPRARAILQSVYPYNVSARCLNRDWFQIPMDQVWKIFCEELDRATEKYGWVIHSFVLMNNHFHLLVSTPNANISKCMEQFMRRVSLRLAKAGNRINECFAGRHFKTVLDEEHSFLNVYKYNYRNPAKSGICDKVEDYPYSTLYYLARGLKVPITMSQDTQFVTDRDATLAWLNTAPDEKIVDAIRKAMKKIKFKSAICIHTKLPIINSVF